ncbi:MAG: hypothetical protein WBP16_03115 [Ferruginibacter sp.]
MFKPVTASILLIAFIAQTFTGPFIWLDYMANTAAYAQNCINKAKPKMHCNGQCQAMKKIQEEEKKDQQNSERKSESKTQVLSSKSFYAIIPAGIAILSKIKKSFSASDGDSIDRSFDIFHPPQV